MGKSKQPDFIRVTLTIRQPLLRRYIQRKNLRELRGGGKLSHQVVLTEIISSAISETK